ncbi:DUF6231 family protein [Psychrobacter sp. 1U2]|uniref:DUF6231 family protein n=1 Tax=Psychrobacter sp. 1U2 TaxID=3453577 RepID=UPI003F488040
MNTNPNPSIASSPTITLPVLIAYTQALLPSLYQATADTGKETQDKPSVKMLWVVENNKEAESLSQQLQEQNKQKTLSNPNSGAHKEKTEANKAENKKAENKKAKDSIETDIEISTLAELNNQYNPQRYELACFWLPTLSKEQLPQFTPSIMRYRDLYAAHLLLAIDNSLDLRAYGFMPFDSINEQSLDISVKPTSHPSHDASLSTSALALWQFNLYDYKRLPNWLNSKYWANPENWDKHRW